MNRPSARIYYLLFYCTCISYSFLNSILHNHQNAPIFANAISIKPADFDRLIMPCYLGGGGGGGGLSSAYSSASQAGSLSAASGVSQNGYPIGRQSSPLGGSGGQQLGSNYAPVSYAGGSGDATSGRYSGGYQSPNANLGQQIPRANSIENFIALVSKIEAANPRLANNPDQLIKLLLGRFRMDNYYYDVRTRTPIIDQDHRTLNLIPAILNPIGQQQQSQYIMTSDVFPEHLLDHDEKCSMYFMLSHFIDKSSPSNPSSLAGLPIQQLTNPLAGGARQPPVLQAAGSGYPAQSANQAFGGGGGAPGMSGGSGSARYPGPAPGFGSPAMNNMHSFGLGASSNNDQGSNQYGLNMASLPTGSSAYGSMRNSPGQYSQNSRYSTQLVDAGAGSRSRDERLAIEYGVVTVANQADAAVVLNRVLMGMLAASMPPQTLRTLAGSIYPNVMAPSTSRLDEELDPLFAVTLADLWAVSAIAKPGKPLDIRLLGDNGRWNDTMCPITFQLERTNAIRFTTAEMLGGLDGFNLGMLRRRLLAMRKNLRLSEMLKMYYSKTGFRPQFAEVSVCNRGSSLISQLDDLHRQSDTYLRLYQLNLPTPDNEIAMSINRLDSFKETMRQAASHYAPPEICQESGGFNEPYPANQQDQCEIPMADVVSILDTSSQANEQFMNLVVAKLAQRIGLSRAGSSLSILTNQQDTTGYSGAYSFNAIVRNSTNTAEIGCALVHDGSRTYQGGQITDPTRLVEMFERALVSLDSEYLSRQSSGLDNQASASSSSSYNRQSTYASSLYNSPSDGGYNLMSGSGGARPRSTGGSKVIVWFNYGSQAKPASLNSYPTSYNGPLSGVSSGYSQDNQNAQWRFNEAKRYLRENFRGASILAVASSREDVKSFVYDEERDIITDIPPSTSSGISATDYYSSSASADPTSYAAVSGPAEQVVNKLLQRMCDIPATFQYPMCFRAPSENTAAVGYISPGRKQYWMMSPKTFFASRTVRMVFKVEGGRLRVCFGRMAKPDESAQRSGVQDLYQSGGLTFGSGGSRSGPNSQAPAITTPGTNNYYTGSEYGVCKEVSQGQEIDFIVDDPCYKKPIAECAPFYYVIKETSNPGEGDPNYMCKDEGCKRFDQVKFTMLHTGVICSSAYRIATTNWLLFVISIVATLSFSGIDGHKIKRATVRMASLKTLFITLIATLSSLMIVQQVHAQQAGVYDYGQGRYGEKRGNLTPTEVLAIILLVMTILAGLALTIGLCYYVTKQQRATRGLTKVQQNDY